MNTIFAPVFMTFHKITDTHILDCGGSLRSLVTPIPMTRIITHLNWDAQWNFVFKKTIPFFWYTALFLECCWLLLQERNNKAFGLVTSPKHCNSCLGLS